MLSKLPLIPIFFLFYFGVYLNQFNNNRHLEIDSCQYNEVSTMIDQDTNLIKVFPKISKEDYKIDYAKYLDIKSRYKKDMDGTRTKLLNEYRTKANYHGSYKY